MENKSNSLPKNVINYQEIVEEMKSIELNQMDLCGVILQYFDIGYKHETDKQLSLDNFFKQPDFLFELTFFVNEAVVLATHALIFDSEINMKKIYYMFIDKEFEKSLITKYAFSKEDKVLLIEFILGLRKEIFQRLFKKQQQLKKDTKISKLLYQQRLNEYIEHVSF